ncbi:C2H2 finger domain protein [Aspergillus sp. HF37]|nr:C2H2 finger domain protein [Aspergillus sp. HF37]
MDSTTETKIPASSLPYTCNSCLVAFRSSDAQRDHMRKDWHLYNMKRRVASLPPVSQETFNEKVLAAKATSTAAAAKASFEKSCTACQKSFYSENTYQNHLQSSKHRSREVQMSKDDSSSVMSSTFSLGEPIHRRGSQASVSKVADNLKSTTIKEEDEAGSGEEEGKYWETHCLFCNSPSPDIQANVDHMSRAHSTFIPERDFLVDLNGLIHYLHRKITENNECVYCHAVRNSTAAIRTHMRDKSHCMIAFETEEEQIEIGQFYDFRSTYSDDEGASTGSGGVKVSGSEEDGWETDDTSPSSMDEDEDEDDEEEEAGTGKNKPVIYQTEYEMHLPSGRSIGHRSLARYYRQNLHNYPTSEERMARQLAIENGEVAPEEQKPRGHDSHHRAVTSRAHGGSGMVGASDGQKRHAVKTEHKDRSRAIRQEIRLRNIVSRNANHQKHYRDHLLQ